VTTYDIVLAATFAALIAVLGAMPGIPIPLLPVPITLQSFGVMLAGALLGPWRGAAAVALLVALVAMGLPLLAGGRGGLPVFAGPTAGFLLGWIPAAFVTGLVAVRFVRSGLRSRWALAGGHILACIAGGIVVDYVCGIAWLVAVTGLPFAKTALGTLAFLPGDLVKATAAGIFAAAIRRVHPIEPK
jgi:biotin transport system substrate-specific component